MYDVFKRLMEERGVRAVDVSRATGVSTSTLTDWKNGRCLPKYDKRRKIADYFGVTVEYLDGKSPFPYGEEKNFKVCEDAVTVRVPIFGAIAAGVELESCTNRIGEIEMTKPKAGSSYWALKIQGNSMAPEIKDNDIVIFRQQSDCDNGEICVVRVNDEDATLKKITKCDGVTILQPLNAEYEPKAFDDSSKDEFEILGVVEELRRKL